MDTNETHEKRADTAAPISPCFGFLAHVNNHQLALGLLPVSPSRLFCVQKICKMPITLLLASLVLMLSGAGQQTHSVSLVPASLLVTDNIQVNGINDGQSIEYATRNCGPSNLCSMTIKISLYCWILGQDKTNIFPVGILSSNRRPPEAIKKGWRLSSTISPRMTSKSGR